ncbi:hypothetical protein GN330_05635 [Nitratireductor sp. CAU 1489]|uniref:Uncharacterized protein n=1 Tax=Nitratireductor arenosus TaxID=2682096 RepID=A0A844QCL4_9HYPH|nr:hypothetical protein [Nitratireductor arenosus]MVA96727.1 hypothetical protein [Nitratireductor arenosus]
MFDTMDGETGVLHMTVGALLFAAALSVTPLAAQGLDSEKAIDTIVGSDVVEEEQQAAAEPERIVKAIENTAQNAREVRRKFNLERIDIVFLPDAAENRAPSEIDGKLKEYAEEIADLRREIEGNAMLYHAIDSRSVMVKDVLAVEFDGQNGATVFAAAKPVR